MSRLLVIRHGQASFGADNYDQLSDLGMLQSERLADYILEREPRFSRLIVGPCQRHAQTAAPTVRKLQEKYGQCPDVETYEELDEFDAFQLFALAEEAGHPAAKLFSDYALEPDPGRQRQLSRALENLMREWARGDFKAPSVESWGSVRTRVESCLRGIMEAAGKGETIAVFTSGGPTGAAVGMALELTDEMAMKACWSVYNAGIADFLFSEGRMSLNRFNHTAHLNLEHLTRR